jgi:uncharacterized protein YpuA (DUF1002 family)
LELEAILEELRTDIKERFVRQEEFKDYKQTVRESLAFVDKKHEELKVTVTDHASRIAALEATLSQDLAAQLQAMAQGYTRFKQEQQQRCEEIENKIRELVQHMVTKVDCEIFDEEMNGLKSAINALSQSTGDDKKPAPQIIQSQGISSKDLNKMRETATKVGELEDMLNKLLK